MPTLDLGIASLSFDVNYPNIDMQIDLVIPHDIPEVGGKQYTLKQFSLSILDPTITIGVDLHLFGGSITVGLDFTTCEVQVSGKVELDVVKKFRWNVGPASIQYMTPLLLLEPSWSVNPVTVDQATLEAAVKAAPQSSTASKAGPSVASDSATQELLKAIFYFAGAGTFIDDMLDALTVANTNLQRDASADPNHPANQSSGPKSGGVLFAFGFTGTGGGLGGLSGGCGIYFTTDALTGDGYCGYFGTAALVFGFISELSLGGCAMMYWPDAGQSSVACFDGYNLFASVDAGEIACGAITLSWPEKSDKGGVKVTSNAPCGVGVALGAGAGFPVNFFAGNSKTWIDVNPPHF